MKNPYEHDWLDDEVRVGRRWQWLALVVFLGFLLVPAASLLVPQWRPGSMPGGGRTLTDRLKSLEEAAKNLPLLEQWRREDQAFASRHFGLGSPRVAVGRDRWLYYRPDLEAVYGKGPYHVEPASVARERTETKWRSSVPVIRAFAEELEKRGVPLVLVPVPTKPMVAGDGLGLRGPHMPPEWDRVLADLSAAGIAVVDLMPVLGQDGAFLRQDTHWTPAAMEAAAQEVARHLPQGLAKDPTGYRVETVEREGRGDLVGMLDLGEAAETLFPPEKTTLRRVIGGPEGATVVSDPESPVVLLGDSFVNVFEDPVLGYAAPGETSIGAGFASHLAVSLGRPAQVIAINGGGATAVREAFAGLPSERLSRVEAVVWVISSRDLLLPELPARRAGIEWRPVSLRTGDAPPVRAGSGGQELIATLKELSSIDDPRQTPYAEAIVSALFETDDGTEHCVFLWAFRDRKLEPAAKLEPGHRYRLRTVPLESDAAASRATRLDDFFRQDLEPGFAAEFERVE